MIRQHAEFALQSGRGNLVHLLIQKEPAGRHHFKSNFVRHDSVENPVKEQLIVTINDPVFQMIWEPSLRCHFLRFFHCFFDGTNHIERLLWNIIVFAVNNFLKSTNGIFQLDVFTGRTRKCFSDVEGLG